MVRKIEIRKARAREPQPQCRAHELSIAARYLRERPKYEFVFRIAERMPAQPLHDLAASVGSDRTLAQSRQQSPLRGDSRVSRTISRSAVARTVVCHVSRAIIRIVAHTVAPPVSRTVSRSIIRIISRTVIRTVSCSVTRSAACAARSSVSHAITRTRRVHCRAAGLAHHRANRCTQRHAQCRAPRVAFRHGNCLAHSRPNRREVHRTRRRRSARRERFERSAHFPHYHANRLAQGCGKRRAARRTRRADLLGASVSRTIAPLGAAAPGVRSVSGCAIRLELVLHRARRASARPAPAGGEPPQARWRSADRSPGRRDIRASPRCSAGPARRARRGRNARGCRTGRAPAPLQMQLARAAYRFGPRESAPRFSAASALGSASAESRNCSSASAVRPRSSRKCP